MNRRNFIRSIACLPAFAFRPGSLACTQDKPRYDLKTILLLQADVAGLRYHDGGRHLFEIRPGDPVTLRREPRNPHDRKAVALYWHGRKLGYLPRVDNSVISNLLDQGALLDATVQGTYPQRDPRERLKVQVVMKG